jgi:prepilin peptidase CpaA
MSPLLYAGIAATAVLACAWDVRERRVPNVLTLPSALAAIVVHLVLGGPDGALTAAGGWLVGLLLFLPWFVSGGMGAGDVKLLAAFGAWLGPTGVLWSGLFAMVAGGALALATALRGGHLGRSLADTWLLAMALRVGAAEGHARHARAGATGIAYAIPVAVGVALTLWLRR